VPTKEELNKGFQIGEWEVLPARRELRRGDEMVRPEPKQLGVLLSLAMRDGDVVTRDELVNENWGGRDTADEPINRCISQLRKHLGDTHRPYQYIDALIKSGYCLKKTVVLHEPTESAPAPIVVQQRKPSRIWAIVALVAVVAVSAWIYDKVTEKPPTVTSIGVLPFENLTGDPSYAYVASGFKAELVHTLQNIPELMIKISRQTYPGLEIDEIAGRLDVDSVLIGVLRKEGDELKFSYQLARADDGVNVSSGMVSGLLQDLFKLQEDLATKVRGHVVGGSGKQLLSTSRPENFDAYERYIRGLFAFDRRGTAGNLEEAVALFEESIQLDPNYGPAYLALAEIYVLLPDYRGTDLVASHERAIEIVEQGIAVDPAIEDAANAVFGFVYHKQKKWALAEEAFVRATSAAVVESNAFNWYSLMLGSVGRFDEALRQALAGIEIDPSSGVINSRVAIVYTWVGDTERAGEFFERGKQYGAGGSTHLIANALFLARQGKTEQANELANASIRLGGGTTDWIDPFFAALADPKQRDKALAAVDLATAENQLSLQIEVSLRVMLGDTDGALRVARMLVQPGEAFEMDLLFLPEFMPLRKRPEFIELLDTLGVTDYWDEVGCVWEDLAVKCP